MSEERRNLLRHMELMDGWQYGEEGSKLAMILEQSCINLIEAHCYGIGRTGQIFEQSRSSEETDRNVDVSTAKVFVSTMLRSSSVQC